MTGYQGIYSDGRTAARQEVSVILDIGGLRLKDAVGSTIALWRYEDLRHLVEFFEGEELRLCLADSKGAGKSEERLSFSDPLIYSELLTWAPQLAVKQQGWRRGMLHWSAATVMATAVLAFVIWVAIPRFADYASRIVPVSWEEKLGEAVLDQVVEYFAGQEEKAQRRCVAEAGWQALEGLIEKLDAAVETPYQFKHIVVDLDVTNAFALPGGQIVVFKGLLDFAESPEEVAAVLAHEMGHVVLRHGTQSMLKSLGITFFFGIMLGDMGSGAIAAAGETLVSVTYSREAETEADTFALNALQSAGITADGLVSFFKRLQEVEGDLPGVLQLLSTHPSSESRAKVAAKRSNGSKGQAMSANDWQALKAICE